MGAMLYAVRVRELFSLGSSWWPPIRALAADAGPTRNAFAHPLPRGIVDLLSRGYLGLCHPHFVVVYLLEGGSSPAPTLHDHRSTRDRRPLDVGSGTQKDAYEQIPE